MALVKTIRTTFEHFDGMSEFKGQPSTEEQKEIQEHFSACNLQIKLYDVLHMGTQNLTSITTNFLDYLQKKFYSRFSIHYNESVKSIHSAADKYIITTAYHEVVADVVVAAVGKSGAAWLKSIFTTVPDMFSKHNYYFGMRMEMSANTIDELIKLSFDPKVFRLISGRRIKLHCVCRKGKIRFARHKHVAIVGGHSPYTRHNSKDDIINNANFNILLSFDSTKLDPNELLHTFSSYSKDSVMAQRLKDFIEGNTTIQAGKIKPCNSNMIKFGNIRKLMDSLDPDFSVYVIEFLRSIAMICPKVLDGDNLFYAPAIEWDMDTVSVNENMETPMHNIFAIGDGAGISQGIVYSAATGIIAARHIVTRFA